MRKILLFSDLHVHPHKGKQERLEDCLSVLDWVVRTARERNIRTVVFGGDLFQERQRIQVYAYHEAWRRIAAAPDLEWVLLLGNHDLWYYDKTDVSSVSPLGSLPNVRVVSTPCAIELEGLPMDFLPFTHNPLLAVQQFDRRSPVLVGHVAVSGAILNFHHKTRAEVSVEFENDMTEVKADAFDGWGKVFLGHYHGAQRLSDSVEYMGSPLQLSFGEAFQEKHILLLDPADLSVEYVKNDFSPRHLILKPEEMGDHDLDGNFVRVYLEDMVRSDITEMRAEMAKKHPTATVTFHPEKKKEQEGEQAEKFRAAEGDVLVRYAETFAPKELDRSRLLGLGKEICLAN